MNINPFSDADDDDEPPRDIDEADVPESLLTDERFDLPGQWATDRVATLAVRYSAPVPFSEKFWKRMVQYSFKGLKKAAGGATGSADAVFLSYRGNDQLEAVPVARYRDPDDPEKGDLWHSTDWQDMWVGSGGSDVVIGPGHTPVGIAAGDYYAVGDQLSLRVDKGFQLGDDGPLFEQAQATVHEQVEREIMVDPQVAAENGGVDAVADGGVSVEAVNDVRENVVARNVDVDQVGLQDYFVDLDDTDRRLLSFWSYKESHPEKMGSDEHKNSELRGRLSEKDEDAGRLAMKLLIIAGLIVVGSLAAVFVLPELLAGGGGGGGGGFVPFGSLVPDLFSSVVGA